MNWHRLPNFRATPTGGRLATAYDLACNRPIHGGSSVDTVSSLRHLGPRSRPCHRPPRPSIVVRKYGKRGASSLCPRHLTAVQNEIRPVFQTRTLSEISYNEIAWFQLKKFAREIFVIRRLEIFAVI
ncbi:hypothetical protein AVEN_66503-1 [Araneus ventricosus]|uniref:Uncharacterized protein n=1 Tax=Araneus ventricosus TaxID=182803 RepID=A0A4Y2PWB0_ARAVE|nr:hypothetical protein AVEN_66503-1 [Araneus ventricosus]